MLEPSIRFAPTGDLIHHTVDIQLWSSEALIYQAEIFRPLINVSINYGYMFCNGQEIRLCEIELLVMRN